MERQTTFYVAGMEDADASGIYEIAPTLEQWRAMQEGTAVPAPIVNVRRGSDMEVADNA